MAADAYDNPDLAKAVKAASGSSNGLKTSPPAPAPAPAPAQQTNRAGAVRYDSWDTLTPYNDPRQNLGYTAHNSRDIGWGTGATVGDSNEALIFTDANAFDTKEVQGMSGYGARSGWTVDPFVYQGAMRQGVGDDDASSYVVDQADYDRARQEYLANPTYSLTRRADLEGPDKYTYERAGYRYDPATGQMQRTSDWSQYQEASTASAYEDMAKFIAVSATLGYGAYAAAGAGGAGAGAGAGAGGGGLEYSALMGTSGAEGLAAIPEIAGATGGAGYAGGGGLAASAGGGGGANMAATNPALIESAVGTPGYGASSAGAGGPAAAPWTSSASAGSDWTKWARQANTASKMMGGGGGGGQAPLPVDEVKFENEWQEEDPYAISSRQAKNGLSAKSGYDANHPIDQNGEEIAAIQTLMKRIDQASAKLAKLKRGKHGSQR